MKKKYQSQKGPINVFAFVENLDLEDYIVLSSFFFYLCSAFCISCKYEQICLVFSSFLFYGNEGDSLHRLPSDSLDQF